jgi:hypothetical protein
MIYFSFLLFNQTPPSLLFLVSAEASLNLPPVTFVPLIPYFLAAAAFASVRTLVTSLDTLFTVSGCGGVGCWAGTPPPAAHIFVPP